MEHAERQGSGAFKVSIQERDALYIAIATPTYAVRHGGGLEQMMEG